MPTTSPSPLSFSRWETALSQLSDANTLLRHGELLDAELLCRDSLAVLLEEAPTRPEVLDAWMLLSELRFRDGDWNEVQLLLQKVLYALAFALHLDEHGQRLHVRALLRMGLCYALQGHPDAAKPVLRQALLRARRQLGEHAVEVPECLNALSFASRRSGRYDLAASQLREALKASRDPALTAQLHRNLARLELERGRPERGEPHARTAIAMLQRDGESVGDTVILLGELLVARQAYPEAERHLHQGLPQVEGEEAQRACAALARIHRARGEEGVASLYAWRAGEA